MLPRRDRQPPLWSTVRGDSYADFCRWSFDSSGPTSATLAAGIYVLPGPGPFSLARLSSHLLVPLEAVLPDIGDVDGFEMDAPDPPQAQPAQHIDRPLMPNGMTFAGLQHIVSNLCEDVNKSMSHWAQFFLQLKSIEAFLRVEDQDFSEGGAALCVGVRRSSVIGNLVQVVGHLAPLWTRFPASICSTLVGRGGQNEYHSHRDMHVVHVCIVLRW